MFAARTGRMAVGKPLFTRVASKHRRLHIILLLIAVGIAATITFANGLSLQYTYDELGRVVASKDRAGREFKYDYNKLGNLLTKTYPDGTNDRYTYDGICRILSAVNKDATVVFTYDKDGRLLSETLTPLGGAGGATTYAYDFLPSPLSKTEIQNER